MRTITTLGLAAVLSFSAGTLFAQSAPKIAVVDTMKVVNECKEGKKIQTTLATFRDQKQGEITAKENELRALEEKIKDPKLAEEKKEEYKAQYNHKVYEYQALSKSAQDELEGRSQKQEMEFQQKLQGVIAKYSQAKGFSLVVERRMCLFNAEALDVTTDIIAEMNKVYPGT